MEVVIKNKKVEIFAAIVLVTLIGLATALIFGVFGSTVKTIFLPNHRPAGMVAAAEEKDDFVDTPGRVNLAFNAEDFGPQGSNGWIFKEGDASQPKKAKKVTEFDGEKHFQYDISGLEIKKDFIHPGSGKAPILEWRVAQDGTVNIDITYVKGVNGDKNPAFPDGVALYVYHDDKLLANKDVEVKTDRENIVELEIKDEAVKKGQSIYIAVDPKNNNAYDGGMLYAAIADPKLINNSEVVDSKRKNNNANNIEDFGTQGTNGWYYQYGTSPEDAKNVSSFKNNGYLQNTSPGLEIKKDFIHPGANKAAILKWAAYRGGDIDLRLKYYKFAQNDGNPNWPDGVKIQVYRNSELLVEKDMQAFRNGDNIFSYDLKKLAIKKDDKFYFIVLTKNNNSYDGGRFEISIRDRSTIQDENSIVIPNDNLRTNNASVMKDFGAQGNNGWFYQFGTDDDPFDAENVKSYEKDQKYYDGMGFEIKKDFVHPGNGKSAIIKWKVAQDGNIEIVSNYTKFPNSDPNPSWPDGTKVTLYHNSKALKSKNFSADRSKEIFGDLSVKQLKVKKGDYITLVVNPKANNAWDAGSYTMTIKDLDHPLVANTVKSNDNINNIASSINDFGLQGSNGWYYYQGTDPGNITMLDEYDTNQGKYFASSAPGLEIKKDFIHPSTQNGAIMRWIVAKDGSIDVLGQYIKFKHADSNPSWPDGVMLQIYKNNELLNQFNVGVNNEKDIAQDISIGKLGVKKGDSIYFIITAKKNNSYDGGKLDVNIYPSTESQVPPAIDNKPRHNTANLASDFGVQGNNGWYYGYGTSDSDFNYALYDEANSKYFQPVLSGLEIKADFVHPSVSNGAIYNWVAGEDGKIDLTGKYTKFTQQDANPSWPDGVKLTIYLNDQVLKQDVIPASTTVDNVKDINIKSLDVKKGDKVYFIITANANNAWDGGELEVSINPSTTAPVDPNPPTDPNPPADTARENNADLYSDFGTQGNNGWNYGYGTSASDFAEAAGYDADNKKYYQSGLDGLEIKPDFVQPAVSKGAVYSWTVGQDGKVDLTGQYTKFTQHDGNPSWPDGTKLTIYHNSSVLQEDVVSVSDTVDNSKQINIKSLDVKQGDKIYFIITANANNAWDGGKLEVSINPVYTAKSLFPKSQQSALSFIGDPMPFYENGKFNIFYLDDIRDSNENGFHPWSLLTTSNFYDYKNEGVVINHSNSNLDQDLALGTGSVIKDKNGLYHAFYTGFNDRRTGIISDANKANLALDFGAQGSNGWNYGYGTSNADFAAAEGYDASNKKYFQSGLDGLELHPDFVHPSVSQGAIYRWTVGEDGNIDLTGKYIKFTQHDGNPSWPDGVKLTIYHNSQVLQEDVVPVSDTTDITRDINIKMLNVKKGDNIYFVITANANNAWDGGRLEISINPTEQAREAVMHAVSTDLKNWTKIPGDTIFAAAQYSKDDFRDPYIFFNEEDNKYWMLITSRKDDKGVIARYTSEDLKTWTDAGVFFTNDNDSASLECPQLFKMGSYWYLTFSDQSAPDPFGRQIVHYRIAGSSVGPFTKQGWDDSFDGNGFYAGRFEKDSAGKVYMFGWNPTKVGYVDSGAYNWGGNLIVHQIKQDSNGGLHAVAVEDVANALNSPVSLTEVNKSQTVTSGNNNYSFSGNGYESVTFSEINGITKIAGKINTKGKNSDFGFMFNVGDNGKAPLNIVFNHQYGRLEFYNTSTDGSLGALESTKPLSVGDNSTLNFTIIIDDSVAVLYVNDEAAFTTRMYNMQNHKWGIFSMDSDVTFSELQMSK